MKHIKLIILLISFSFSMSCSKDRDDISLSTAEADQLKTIMLQGEWKIAEYSKDGEVYTANYTDYIFVFSNNNELKANSSAETIIGTWRVSNDAGSEIDSYYDVDFNIFFGSAGKLAELTSNYDVISATNSEVKLTVEKASGEIIYLNFSRN